MQNSIVCSGTSLGGLNLGQSLNSCPFFPHNLQGHGPGCLGYPTFRTLFRIFSPFSSLLTFAILSSVQKLFLPLYLSDNPNLNLLVC